MLEKDYMSKDDYIRMIADDEQNLNVSNDEPVILGMRGRSIKMYLQEHFPVPYIQLEKRGLLDKEVKAMEDKANKLLIEIENDLQENNPLPPDTSFIDAVSHNRIIHAQAEELLVEYIYPQEWHGYIKDDEAALKKYQEDMDLEQERNDMQDSGDVF